MRALPLAWAALPQAQRRDLFNDKCLSHNWEVKLRMAHDVAAARAIYLPHNVDFRCGPAGWLAGALLMSCGQRHPATMHACMHARWARPGQAGRQARWPADACMYVPSVRVRDPATLLLSHTDSPCPALHLSGPATPRPFSQVHPPTHPPTHACMDARMDAWMHGAPQSLPGAPTGRPCRHVRACVMRLLCRGRAYPVHVYLNQMGDDLSRGLLEFGEGKRLGAGGMRWLWMQVSGAERVAVGSKSKWLQARQGLAVHAVHVWDQSCAEINSNSSVNWLDLHRPASIDRSIQAGRLLTAPPNCTAPRALPCPGQDWPGRVLEQPV